MPAVPGTASSTADAVFAALSPVIDGIVATFGRSCEVVLHDYRDQERSVVAVAGSVTGREVGDAMSEIGLRVLAAGTTPATRSATSRERRTGGCSSARRCRCATPTVR